VGTGIVDPDGDTGSGNRLGENGVVVADKFRQLLSGELLKLVGNLSDGNMLKALTLLEKAASIRWHHKGFDGIRSLIESGHGSIEGARRMIRAANPSARAALLNNFVLGSLLLGYKKRLAFYNRHGAAPPGTLMISPTLKCNLRCFGCYAGTHQPREELTREEVTRLLADARAAGTHFILVLGGEPFMVPWLLDVIDEYPDLAFLIFSNGLLIDEERVRRLAASGNAAVAIGIDGLREETEARKGKGSFDNAMSTMRRLAAAGVITGFSAMTSRRNFDTLHSDEFFDTMIANGATFCWIPIAVPQGSACFDRDLLPTPEQKARIPQLIRDIKRRKPLLIADFLTDAHVTEGCGAARILWHVNANGDVEPCVLMPFAVDNIREKSFLEIIESDFFTRIRSISRRHCPASQTCLTVYQPAEVLEAVQRCGARETSAGTLTILHEMAEARRNQTGAV
jgi:MoaA/NifB/PqqE/SkfB family radical SAM enzyme